MPAQRSKRPSVPPAGAAAGSEREAEIPADHPPLPADEERRLDTLAGYGVLDSERDARFEALVTEVARDCGVPIATITFLDATRQWFKASVGIELSETSRDDALCAYTILDPGRPMVIPDTSLDARFRDNALVVGEPGLMAYAGTPIVAPDGTVMGTVCAMDLEPHAYSADDLAVLARVSRQVVQLLEDARAAAELATGAPAVTTQEAAPIQPDPALTLARPLIEAIGEDLDVVQLVDEFCRSVLDAFGWWAARVAWVQGDTLHPGEWLGARVGPAAFAPLDGRVAAPTNLDDLSVTFHEATLLDVSMMRWISDRDVVASLGARHAVVIDVPGALSLAARLEFLVPTARALDASAIRTLATATAVLPRVVVQQRARQELTYRATHDALTGLSNREGLERALGTSDDSVTHRRGLLYVDVDDFKRINDAQGHRVGDEVLVRLGRLLGAHVRPTDTIARLGGDEFVIALEGIERDEEIVRVARRLLRSLCGPMTVLRTIRIEASVSIGAVRWSTGALEAGLEKADRLMYSAKELGGARAALDGDSGRLILGPDERDASDLDDALDGAVDVRTGAILGLDDQGNVVHHGVRGLVSSSLRHPDVNDLARAVEDAISEPLSSSGVVRLQLARELWETEGLSVRLLAALRERLPAVAIEVAFGPGVFESEGALESVVAVRDGLGLPVVLVDFGAGRGDLALLDLLRPTVIELAATVIADIGALQVQGSTAGRAVLPSALVAARALAADRGAALSAAGDASLLESPRADGLIRLLANMGVATVAVQPETGRRGPDGRRRDAPPPRTSEQTTERSA